ncbi:MAG: hypothetical protein V5A30_11295 [Haloarculaceae archaeon]
MPYLHPELVLRRFSSFAREEVRPAIVGDGDEFLEAQVGSMSSTLDFLSKELDGMRGAVEAQHEALLEALDGGEQALAGIDATAPEVRAAVEDGRDRLAEPPADVYDHEQLLLAVSSDVLAAVEAGLEGEAARTVREPVYGFLDVRVTTQLEMLGRESDD